VDLFSDAIEWKMASGGKDKYTSDDVMKSWGLFQKQLQFQPIGSVGKVDFATERADAQGASITDIKKEAGNLEFKLQNEAGAGPVLLQITHLAPGNYALSVDGTALGKKSAAELEKGVDLASNLRLPADSKTWNEELRKGHELSASLSGIASFKLPRWVEVSDFENQKQAAIQNVLQDLEKHDARMVELSRPQPMDIRIAKTP
jgi:hypothetical protein